MIANFLGPLPWSWSVLITTLAVIYFTYKHELKTSWHKEENKLTLKMKESDAKHEITFEKLGQALVKLDDCEMLISVLKQDLHIAYDKLDIYMRNTKHETEWEMLKGLEILRNMKTAIETFEEKTINT